MSTQDNMNLVSTQTPTEARHPSVRENVAEELSKLRDDLWRIAEEVRMKSKGASAEVQSTFEALEHEVERFSQQVKVAAKETQDDVRQAGEDLRMRFQKLSNQIVLPAS